jgi:hypothetical protein
LSFEWPPKSWAAFFVEKYPDNPLFRFPDNPIFRMPDNPIGGRVDFAGKMWYYEDS